MDVNVFTQIGFVVLIGLASKNAILIVEFAKYRREEGASAREATLHACELRLRPIMMTSFAFILGVLPLVVAHGAGFEMRRALGTAVFSGMLGVTFFGIFLTPVFFFVIDGVTHLRVFSSGTLHKISDGLLDTLRFGFIRRPAASALRRLAQAGAKPKRARGKSRPAPLEISPVAAPLPQSLESTPLPELHVVAPDLDETVDNLDGETIPDVAAPAILPIARVHGEHTTSESASATGEQEPNGAADSVAEVHWHENGQTHKSNPAPRH
jgi:hypothetical protein